MMNMIFGISLESLSGEDSEEPSVVSGQIKIIVPLEIGCQKDANWIIHNFVPQTTRRRREINRTECEYFSAITVLPAIPCPQSHEEAHVKRHVNSPQNTNTSSSNRGVLRETTLVECTGVQRHRGVINSARTIPVDWWLTEETKKIETKNEKKRHGWGTTVHVTLLAFCVLLVAFIEAKPLQPSLYVSDYQYPSEAFGLQPQLVQYQSSPYYLYNVHANVNAIPATIIADAKPSVTHVPAYGIYYGSPVYDFRLPLNPVYPVLKPVQPGELPTPSPEPSTTVKPTEDNEDGIEKLDAKAEPEKDMQKPIESSENSDDDSVVIESI